MHGTINWVQIGTDTPQEAQRFYGELFGWTFSPDPHSAGYDLITTPGAEQPSGGVATTEGESYAIFCVVVSDVAEAVRRTEQLGGKVQAPPRTTPDGLELAHLLDPAGNHFCVYAPPPAG